jgi:hypothetical protein
MAGLCGTISTPNIITKSSEVIDMAEKKAKPATKKVATAKVVTTAKKVVVKKTAEKIPVAKKPAVKKPAAAVKKAATAGTKKKAPVKKAAGKKAATSTAKPAGTKKNVAKPTPEERYRMVETTAYFIAERNGFQGDSAEHWAEAEREIATRLDW